MWLPRGDSLGSSPWFFLEVYCYFAMAAGGCACRPSSVIFFWSGNLVTGCFRLVCPRRSDESYLAAVVWYFGVRCVDMVALGTDGNVGYHSCSLF